MNIPDNVKRVISLIRESGVTNMLDRRVVISLAEGYDPDVALFLESHSSDYLDIIKSSISEGERWLND